MIVLPRDATPIDFAYAIHSDVGNTCVGAKVNGRIVPLKYALRNGDVVEILTQTGHLPSKDWLALVKTSRARNKIKHVINTTERVKAIEIGEKYLEREARRLGVPLSRIAQGADSKRWRREYGCSKIEDLHAALGYGKYLRAPGAAEAGAGSGDRRRRGPRRAPSRRVRPRAAPPATTRIWSSRSRASTTCWSIAPSAAIRSAAKPSSATSRAARASPCTRTNCTNVQNLMYEVERKIDVEWARARQRDLPGAHAGPHRRPPGHAESAHHGPVQRSRSTSAAWKRAATTSGRATAPSST